MEMRMTAGEAYDAWLSSVRKYVSTDRLDTMKEGFDLDPSVEAKYAELTEALARATIATTTIGVAETTMSSWPSTTFDAISAVSIPLFTMGFVVGMQTMIDQTMLLEMAAEFGELIESWRSQAYMSDVVLTVEDRTGEETE